MRVVLHFTEIRIGRDVGFESDDLAAAVRQLRAHAGTLESLTISRERNRVARELHDTLAHTLSGLTVQLEAARAYWAVDPARAQALLDKAQDSARQGLQETRHALTALRASPLEDLGLALALRNLAEAAAARANLDLELSLPDSLPLMPPDVEQCLYRVAQEAIANVIYHADARHMKVALCRQSDSLELVVQDDGMGFAPDATVPPGHFGLAGMRERARLVAGHLTVQSQGGAGTTVRLEIAQEGAAA
jgi:signal transduction histidine kinase